MSFIQQVTGQDQRARRRRRSAQWTLLVVFCLCPFLFSTRGSWHLFDCGLRCRGVGLSSTSTDKSKSKSKSKPFPCSPPPCESESKTRPPLALIPCCLLVVSLNNYKRDCRPPGTATVAPSNWLGASSTNGRIWITKIWRRGAAMACDDDDAGFVHCMPYSQF